jgi:hypothetical protein
MIVTGISTQQPNDQPATFEGHNGKYNEYIYFFTAKQFVYLGYRVVDHQHQ